MDEEQLQRIYDAHRDQGASEADALAAVEVARQGAMSEQVASDPNLEAQRRLSEGGGSKWGDMAHGMMQGASFSFSDELRGLGAKILPGGDDYTQARDNERQIQKDSALLNPGFTGANTLSNIAGGIAVPLPFLAGSSAMRGGGGVVRGAAAGALGGSVQGGLTGLGGAEGSVEERLPEAKMGAAVGAAFGAGLGAFPPVANAFARGGNGVSMRLQDLLRKTTGVEDDLQRAASKAQLKEAVAGAELGALDAANPSITDPRVLAALDPNANRFMGRAVNSVEPGGFSGAKAPSLEQIRTVRQELKDAAERAAKKPRTTVARGYREARGELTDAVDDAVPGFREANRSYAQTQSRIEGLGFKSQQGKLIPRGGNRLSTKTADEARIALEGQFPEMQEGMRTRFVNDITSSLNEGGGEWLKNMVSRSPETLAKLRNAFPDNDVGSQSFKEMLSELAMEESSARTRAFGTRALRASPWLVAGGYGLSRLLGGSSDPSGIRP